MNELTDENERKPISPQPELTTEQLRTELDDALECLSMCVDWITERVPEDDQWPDCRQTAISIIDSNYQG